MYVLDGRNLKSTQILEASLLGAIRCSVSEEMRGQWSNDRGKQQMSTPPADLLDARRYFPDSTPKRLIEGVLPQILEQVSWQLCGPRREEATVALQAVAHISYRQAVSAFAVGRFWVFVGL